MSVFQKMAYGAAESINRQAKATVDDNMELRRQERLAEVERKARGKVRQDEVDFNDSRYSMLEQRRQEEKRADLELAKEYAKPGASPWKYETRKVTKKDADGVEYETEEGFFVNERTLEERPARKPDMLTGRERFFANNPEATEADWDRIVVERKGGGYQPTALKPGATTLNGAEVLDKIKGLRLRDAEAYYEEHKRLLSKEQKRKAEEWLSIKRDPEAHMAGVQRDRKIGREERSVIDQAAKDSRREELRKQRESELARIKAWNAKMNPQ